MVKKEAIWLAIFTFLGFVSLFFDEKISELIKSAQNPYWTAFFKLFDPLVIMAILGIVMLALLIWKDKKEWIVPFMFSVALAALVSFALKFIFMRPRPDGVIKFIAFTRLADYSFPSSHTTAIFSILPILGRSLKKTRWIWVLLAGLIAISRIYLGEHYLSDVIFGGVIGYFIGWIAAVAGEKHILKKKKADKNKRKMNKK